MTQCVSLTNITVTDTTFSIGYQPLSVANFSALAAQWDYAFPFEITIMNQPLKLFFKHKL